MTCSRPPHLGRRPYLLPLLCAALLAWGCGSSSSGGSNNSGGNTTPTLASITVSPAAPSIAVGATQAFTAAAKDSTGAAMTGLTFTWTSSNTAVATITSAGVATAVAAGTTQITAKSGSITSAAVTLTVTPPPVASITVAPASASIQVGQTQQYTATAKDAGGNTLSGVTFTWASSATGVATISSAGLASAVAAGSTQITAAGGGVTSSPAALTVTPAGSVTGTAATGAPLANATVTLVDSTGVTRTATTAADGTFTLLTGGLTPPFVLKVQPASGNPLYSVSADANANSVVNVDPLTDLIIRSWYSTQGQTVDTGFASPAALPPPTPAQVQLISNVVLQVTSLWLTNNGVDTTTFNLISTPFAANGVGLDKVLDQTTVDTSTHTVKITDGTTTQNSTVTYDTTTSAVTINSSTTNGTSTSVSSVSTIAPTQTAQADALAGITATMNSFAASLTAKGAALTAADISPFIAPNALNDGLSASLWTDSIVTDLRGQTGTVSVTSLNSLDSTGAIADATFNFTETGGGTQSLDFQFRKVNGTWLIAGNQRITNLSFSAEMRTNQGAQATGSGPDINVDVQAPQGTVTGVTMSGGGVWNNSPTQASGQVDQTFQPPPTTREDIFLDHSDLEADSLTSLIPA
ncbi:MAG: Ig-like domain-containing protein, partial [Terriglobales bacterium]